MSLVLDASMALSWHFRDESTPAGRTVLQQVVDGGAVVPAHWRLEVANGLRTAVRRQRLTQVDRDAALQDLRALGIEADPETDARAWGSTLTFADRFGLTPYDAAYLELAQRRGLPLASLDRPLRQAGATLGLVLLGVAG